MKRRQVRFESWGDVLEDVDLLHRRGYDQAGNWSLGQVCNHLASGINMTLSSSVPRLVQRTIVFCFLRLLFLGKIGNVLRLRMPTGLPQTVAVDAEIGRQRLQTEIARLKEADEDHLTRFHLWHCGHHLSFLIPRSVGTP